MPIYQYSCPSCGKDFEEHRKIADRFWNDPCPLCGSSEPIALVVTSPKIVAGVGDNLISKTESRFKDKLEAIKKHHPNSTIRT